jgi:hypothetical protein
VACVVAISFPISILLRQPGISCGRPFSNDTHPPLVSGVHAPSVSTDRRVSAAAGGDP